MTTCAKCGTENVAGDAFCGNCGAFLEFAAEEAAEAGSGLTAAAPPPGTADAAPAGPPPQAGESGPVVSPPTPAAVAGAAVPAGSKTATEPGTGGPTCTACGRPNPAGRRFCISCGERLPSGVPGVAAPAGAAPSAGTAGPGSAPPATSSPAPGGPARPAWDFPTAPVPAAQSVPAAEASVAGTGGRSRLPLAGGIVLVLALVGGVAFVALNGGLGGGTPAATGTPAPSVAVASSAPSPAPTETPASPAASLATTPEPTAVPTIPPGPSVGIKIKGAKASSQLSAKRSVKNLYDGSPATTWKSASDKFEGSWIEVSFAPAAVTRIQVWSGWQVEESFFYGNHRPRNVTVAFDGGDPQPLLLKDVLGAQRVDIPPELGITRATRVRITIVDVYPARKTTAGGSPTDQVAVSEIKIFGVPVTP